MYNGIGLTTPRGSGTNGYVQRNLAFINTIKEKQPYKTDDEIKRSDAAQFKEPNKEILEHERKRKIEVKCFELEQTMEDQGYTETEINFKVSAFRKKLLEEMKQSEQSKRNIPLQQMDAPINDAGRLVPKGTHETAAVNMLKNTVFKEALGIGADFQDGKSMELSNIRRQEEAETKRLLEAQTQLKALESSSDESEEVQEKKKKKQKAKKRKHLSSDSETADPVLSDKKDKHKKKRHKSSKSTSRKSKRSHSGERSRHRH